MVRKFLVGTQAYLEQLLAYQMVNPVARIRHKGYITSYRDSMLMMEAATILQ